MTPSSIERINEYAGHWVASFWRASWQGGLFVLGVWAVCAAFRRLHPNFRYWLWWLAAAQFLARLAFVLPVTLSLPGSDSVIGRSETVTQQPVGDDGSANGASVPSATPSPNSGAMWVGSSGAVAPDESKWTVPNDPSRAVEAAAALPIPARLSTVAYLMGGWLLAVAGLSVAATRKIRRSQILIASATPCRSESTLALAAHICAQRNLKVPAILESYQAPCALLSGWMHPTVVLPSGLSDTLDRTQLEMALTHELTHFQRRDLWSGLVPTIACIVFVFHPLVWLCSREASIACEEACDTEVLRSAGGNPAAYARLLLDSARSAASFAALGTALGYRSLHRRISMLNHNRSVASRRTRTFGIATVSFLAVCALPWSVTAQTALKVHPKAHIKHKAHVAVKRKAAVKPRLAVAPPAPRAGALPSVAATAPFPPAPAGPHGGFAAPSIATTPPTPSGFGGTAPSAAFPPVASSGIGFGTASGAPVPPATPRPGFGSGSSASQTGIAPLGGQLPPSARYGAAKARNAKPASRAKPTIAGPTADMGFGGGSVSFGPTPTQPRLPGANPTAPRVTTGAFIPAVSTGSGFDMGTGQGVTTARSPDGATGAVELITPRDDSKGIIAVVRVTFHHYSLRKALERLFETAHQDYMIKSTVDDDIVTCALDGVELQIALDTIIASVKQQLTYRNQGNTVYILPKSEAGN